MLRALTHLSALTAAAVLTATAGSATAAAAEPAVRASYVALGDSFTSGAFLPTRPTPCARAVHNYPTLVAEAMSPRSFDDVSCGGAATADMTRSQFPGTSPQFDALASDTTLVSVSIGGNDVPFAEVVAVCGFEGMTHQVGSPCKDLYQRDGRDELADRIRTVGGRIGTVLDGIHQHAPHATVLVIGYPVLMPDSGPGCWPRVPLAEGDQPYLRDLVKLMNRVMADQAAQHDAAFVDTYTSSIGHDWCKAPGVAWMEGPIPASPTAPVHPNALGARNQADQIIAALRHPATR